MTHPHAPHLGPLVSGDEITSELRRRKRTDIYQTVRGSSPALIAEKVKLEEEDGWRTVRQNAKSTRMAKPKPLDEQLEDELWCILAQMGFGEMSKGRQFAVAVGNNLPPRQIDVYAKDDEAVAVVECTQRRTPGKKRMSSLVEKIVATRRSLLNSIRRAYEPSTKPKVKFVIATRNVSWSDADLAKCKEAKIAVITDSEIDYYRALVQHLKHAARYQFLGHLFGGQKIDGLNKQVLATRGRMGGHTFYTFLIRPEDLLKIAYVGHKASRNTDDLATYQRMLQPRRLKKIAQYINGGGRFPTNIVVNLKTSRRSGLRFDIKDNVDDVALGTLYLPPNYASAWVIDGQHRLYGYEYARAAAGFKQGSTALPVLAYENLPSEKEMDLFIDINSKQVKVSTGLLVELYADLHWESSNTDDAFQALLSRVASRLNGNAVSPLHGRMVVSGKRKTAYRCLTQTSIRDGLLKSKLLGTLRTGAVVPGPLSTARANDYAANLRKAVRVVSDCLGVFANGLEDHWRLGDAAGGYLCTNNGIRALFHVMKDVADDIQQKQGVDLCLLDAEATFERIAPYLEILLKYFEDASSQEIRSYRRIGSSLTAVRQQAFGLETQINKQRPGFQPAGLQEYLESRDEAGTEEAAASVRRIHQRLFGYVIGALKEHFGTVEKAWWTSGIPVRIRQKCAHEWEAKNRDGEEESHLYLIDYVEICREHWDLVKTVVSLDSRHMENWRESTKWIKDLNEIRKITTHPERGVLSTTQVTFVKDCLHKVEMYFPEGGTEGPTV